MHLRWNPHPLASALHAAQAVTQGAPIVDAALAAAVAGPAAALARWPRQAALDEARFWHELIPLAARTDSQRALAEALLTKLVGRQQVAPVAVADLAGLVAAVDRALRDPPRRVEELRLRVGPLRELWEARGPGLLVCLRHLLGAEVLAAEAEVLLVHPICGGGGEVHALYNSIRVEAVLTHLDPALPETLRLAWLLAQLQLELPHFSDGVPPRQLPALGALGMVLPVLAAAEEVELARGDDAALHAAWRLWRLERFAPREFAPTLRSWWQVYVDSRPPFRTALGALVELLKPLAGG